MAAADRHSARPADRPHQAAAPVARPDHQRAAADPVNGVAAVSMILLRARAERRDLPGFPRRVLSDPAQHDFRGALGRPCGCSRRPFDARQLPGSAMFRQVVLPASLPSICNGLRVAHGFAWILIVVGRDDRRVPTGLGSVIMEAARCRAPTGGDRHDRDRRHGGFHHRSHHRGVV